MSATADESKINAPKMSHFGSHCCGCDTGMAEIKASFRFD
jgi:hypothetical protein